MATASYSIGELAGGWNASWSNLFTLYKGESCWKFRVICLAFQSYSALSG